MGPYCVLLKSFIPRWRKKMVSPLEKKSPMQYIYRVIACELNNKV